MNRPLRLLLLLGLTLAAGTVLAQATTKAYAPDDLNRIEVRDRVRVIELEYSEQSGGARIPDDQLEFYLDQIDSGWTFARIKQDIAESLGGGGRPGNPGGGRDGRDGHGGRGDNRWQPPQQGWQPDEVICSSQGQRYNECQKPFRGPAVLSESFSEVRCIEGQTWGQKREVIWVDRGCRGRFRADTGWQPSAGAVICESKEGRLRRCPTPFRGPAQIAEQRSNAACIEGRTWGSTPGEIWVTRGCRAAFIEARGRGLPVEVYNVTCASDDGQYRSCAWNPRAGQPYLIEQLSSSACIEGRTWGYTRDGLWVNRGCRARFGAR